MIDLELLDCRGNIDERNEKTGRKIRDAELNKIPYMLVVGEKEAAEGTISVRKRGEGDLGAMSVDTFANRVNEEVRAMIE
jgi:threonyl-tRNA synthetase